MENLTKIEKAIIKVIDKAAYVFLTAMAVMFLIIGLAAICTGFDIVRIFGFIASLFCASACWNFRKA